MTDYDLQIFERLFYLFMDDVNNTARKSGWWEQGRTDGDLIALMHSELSEALDAVRHDYPKDEHCPEFGNFEVELADCIIRIMDFANQRGLPLAEALLAKAAYNKTRSHRHGGKKL